MTAGGLVDANPIVRPLGRFSGIGPGISIADLAACVHQLEVDPAPVVDYLRHGAIVFAIMEQTYDRLGRRFSVAGGSAILTDGTYYWRLDTADYVEHYRIALPSEFLRHGDAVRWRHPTVEASRVLQIDVYLLEQMQA